jgi:hypothetical protein
LGNKVWFFSTASQRENPTDLKEMMTKIRFRQLRDSLLIAANKPDTQNFEIAA